ncbi:MAG: MurR/RpiR family transcriptional regulator [Clostridiales Family XIII bacterium]|jgi:RpiR family glv operon transcriptional regulator|nr:MurR/RpiR family transcriptional regulator [Clostridiales Family XIII bacterium]
MIDKKYFEQRALACFEDMTESDIEVYRFILSHKSEAVHISIDSLAAELYLSHSSVGRFLQKLGYDSFADFKKNLQEEIIETTIEAPSTKQMVLDYKASLDYMAEANFSELFERMDRSKRIYVFGTGAVQKQVASEFVRQFLYCDKLLYIVDGYEEAIETCAKMTSDDLIFIISASGEDEFVNHLLSVLMDQKVGIASITASSDNTLAWMADYKLHLSVTEDGIMSTVPQTIFTAKYFMLIDIMINSYRRRRCV